MEERRIIRSGSASEVDVPVDIVLSDEVFGGPFDVSVEDVVGWSGRDEVGFSVGNV